MIIATKAGLGIAGPMPINWTTEPQHKEKKASGSKGPLSVGVHVFRRRTMVQVMGCLSLTQSKELHGLGA